tara:strand:- start:1786 stop:2391 length:606 start_codon:yes stop_codon:yes gene_type:complete
MPKINENFQSIFKDIKYLLFNATKNRNHPFHTPVFSNISDKNIVENRLVVLRKFDDKKMIINFHTDFRSPKIKGIEKNSNSSFLFYDPEIKIQLRIKSISTINNQNKITQQAWNFTKLSSRKCYLTKKSPSSISKKPEDGIPKHLKGIDPSIEESEDGYKNFVVMQNKILKIDWLNLASSGHRRLSIDFKNQTPYFEWLIP